MSRVSANDLEDRVYIPGRVVAKTQKMVLDTSLLNTQNYKACIKGKLKRPPLHLGMVAIEKGVFGLLLTTVGQLYLLCL